MPAADPSTPTRDLREKINRRLQSSALRRRIKASAWYWRIKLLLKRLSGRELWLRRELSVATDSCDGWRYSPAGLHPGARVYAFGVGDTLAFETALIERHGVVVHAFDPTPAALAWIESQRLPRGLVFHPWAIAGADGTLTLYPRVRRKGRKSRTMWTADPGQADSSSAIVTPAYTLESIMRELGHERIDLLKLDVEGAEYDAIDAMLRAAARPGQILVEFHHRFPAIGKRRTAVCIERLRAAGYAIFAIAPTGRELSFIRSSEA